VALPPWAGGCFWGAEAPRPSGAGSAAPVVVRRLRLRGAAVCYREVLRVREGTGDTTSARCSRESSRDSRTALPRENPGSDGASRVEAVDDGGTHSARRSFPGARRSATVRRGTGVVPDRPVQPWTGRNASPSHACASPLPPVTRPGELKVNRFLGTERALWSGSIERTRARRGCDV